MIKINIESDPKFKKPNDSVIFSLISYVMEQQEISDADLLFIFGDDKLLNHLKKQFFNKDHFTDVIAFRLNDYNQGNIEGEVYISLTRAKNNAKKFNEPYSKEIARLVIHGSLHSRPPSPIKLCRSSVDSVPSPGCHWNLNAIFPLPEEKFLFLKDLSV